MMIITGKSGNLDACNPTGKTIDWLQLEWYEAPKRILHKQTNSGLPVSLKFLGLPQQLTHGDILFEDKKTIIAVEIMPCDAMVIYPANMYEMAAVSYEIGNKHLPLFFEADALLVPFDLPLFKLLTGQGYVLVQEKRRLLQPLTTTVIPHTINIENKVLFSKSLG